MDEKRFNEYKESLEYKELINTIRGFMENIDSMGYMLDDNGCLIEKEVKLTRSKDEDNSYNRSDSEWSN